MAPEFDAVQAESNPINSFMVSNQSTGPAIRMPSTCIRPTRSEVALVGSRGKVGPGKIFNHAEHDANRHRLRYWASRGEPTRLGPYPVRDPRENAVNHQTVPAFAGAPLKFLSIQSRGDSVESHS